MCQISARMEHAFMFYGRFYKVSEMKKKTKKLKQNFGHSYFGTLVSRISFLELATEPKGFYFCV